MIDWLRGKRRNRRFGEREHVLDVKLRTSRARAARLRVFGVGAAVVLSLAAAWRGGQWLLDRLIYKNDAFAIEHIEVQTDGVLTSETIRRWAMVKTGENLMALDLARVQRNLEMQPPVQFAAVERVLPRTLKLSVNEREPVAQTMIAFGRADGGVDQAIYDFDEDGYALQPLDPRWRTSPPPASERLPILVDVAPTDVQLGRQTESPQIRGNPAVDFRLRSFAHGRNGGAEKHQCGCAGNSGRHHQPGGGDNFFAESIRRAVAPLAAHLRSIPEVGQGDHLAGLVHCQ